jgi:hypothetical protein
MLFEDAGKMNNFTIPLNTFHGMMSSSTCMLLPVKPDRVGKQLYRLPTILKQSRWAESFAHQATTSIRHEKLMQCFCSVMSKKGRKSFTISAL